MFCVPLKVGRFVTAQIRMVGRLYCFLDSAKNFIANIFFWKHFFCYPIFLWPKFLLRQKLFLPNIFLPKIFSSIIFFHHKFLWPKFFLTIYFLSINFFDQNYMYRKISRTNTFLKKKKIWPTNAVPENLLTKKIFFTRTLFRPQFKYKKLWPNFSWPSFYFDKHFFDQL